VPEERFDSKQSKDSRRDPRDEFGILVPVVHARIISPRRGRSRGFRKGSPSYHFYGQVGDFMGNGHLLGKATSQTAPVYDA
jgi:hypothetical protein